MTKKNKEDIADNKEELGEEIQEDEINEEELEAEKEPEKPEEEEDANIKYLRLMADFQNYKKRSEKERQDVFAYANEKIVKELLEVMDNFERALDHDIDKTFKDGMEMIFNQLKGLLDKSGVEEIKAENTEFDPNIHNAVLMEDTDKVDSGKVSQVLQKGYKLNGKVIRPSMVKVAN